MATWIWVVIVIAVVAVIALIVTGARKRRTAVLRDRFGPEYDRTVENSDGRRAAEADLLDREKRRAEFDIKPLPEAARLSYSDEWQDVQEHFVDEPTEATAAADALVTRVMEARGYPMQNFDAQAELVSVDHPNTVEDYRFAHDVRQRSENQQASTEELREALLRYRALFSELLRPDGADPVAQPRDPAGAELQDEEANGPADDPTAMESDGTSPVASDLDYHDQQIGR
jgi:FtsZ-interacting cell division protein ZipA